MRRLEFQGAARRGGIGYQIGRIAGAARLDDMGYGAAAANALQQCEPM
jgi:hypothetical protein